MPYVKLIFLKILSNVQRVFAEIVCVSFLALISIDNLRKHPNSLAQVPFRNLCKTISIDWNMAIRL